MRDNIKKLMVPLILMTIFSIVPYYLGLGDRTAGGLKPELGLLPIMGLLFGPYGALGCSLGLTLSNIITDGRPLLFTNFFVPFGISYLSYKLWYSSFESKSYSTKPRLINTKDVQVFMGIILLTGILFTTINKKIIYMMFPQLLLNNTPIGVRYFINYINFSFIFGVIGMWLSRFIDFIHVPKKFKEYNRRFYKIILGILSGSVTLIAIIDFAIMDVNHSGLLIQVLFFSTLTVIYLTKPIYGKIEEIKIDSISETIIGVFLATGLVIASIGIIAALVPSIPVLFSQFTLNQTEAYAVYSMMQGDAMFTIFFIPAFIVLKYIENKVLNPIVSFSKIEKFIKKGNKMDADNITGIYSEYLDENNEIGILAHSYTDLINNANDYIEDIHRNEIEKERNKTEIKVAKSIQESAIPTECIENKDYTIYGISKPAKEVGGDFYNYYSLDEDNVVIIIGDATGKGIPAALLSATTQPIIKQIITRERDPSKALYLLNNHICDNNYEDMFISLWIGIYNNKTKIMTFSNAGHNSPLLLNENRFEPLKMDKNTVLGIEKDYEFTTEKVKISKGMLAYTNGVTDMKNSKNESFSENRLITFLNQLPDKNNIINKIMETIEEFSEDSEQSDDMTLLYMKIHE